MAITAEGRRLTDTHRRLQVRIAALTVRGLLGIWMILGTNPPTGSRSDTARLEAWLVAAEAIIRTTRHQSTIVARRYYDDFRLAEIGQRLVNLPSVSPPPLTVRQVRTGLMVHGPVEWRHALDCGLNPFEAGRSASVQAAREASRQALTGGRDFIVAATRVDTRVTGWSRSLRSDNPCAFCAMLASRGPVYGSAMSASFEAHTNCLCQPEPFYASDPTDRSLWAPGANEARDLWVESTRGQRDQLNAFRRAWESRHASPSL